MIWISSRAGCIKAALLAAPSRLCRRPSCAVLDARWFSRLVQDESKDTSSLEAMTAGLPVFVGQTETSGRGLYAARFIPAGENIHTATPLVAHPTLRNLRTNCYHCLAPLRADKKSEWIRTHGGNDGGGVAGHFCGQACASSASSTYHEVETAVGDAAAPLVRRCASHSLKFPLAAARLAYAVAQGSVSPTVTDALVKVNFPPGVAPEDWLEEHAMLRVALTRGVAMAAVGAARQKNRNDDGSDGGSGNSPSSSFSLEGLDRDWYVGVLARMHLNSFRVEIPPSSVGGGQIETPDGGCGHDHGDGTASGACGHDHGHGHASSSNNSSFAETLEAAMTSAVSGTASGTALYAAPSLLNHSCCPNVEVRWLTDGRMSLTAARVILPNEPLTITYVDCDAPVTARREKLKFAYGFACTCERCLEETGEETK